VCVCLSSLPAIYPPTNQPTFNLTADVPRVLLPRPGTSALERREKKERRKREERERERERERAFVLCIKMAKLPMFSWQGQI
jgi:hypothetical protein